MGEIKSTLDIIMEKTKDLIMTDEEKRAFQKSEVEGKIRGLLQKYLNGMMSLETLRKEINAFDENRYKMAREALIKGCMDRIDPEAENTPIFDALERLADIETGPLRKVQTEFHRDLEEGRAVREKGLMERLQERGISGSAVIPNLNADPEWVQYMSEMEERFMGKVVSLCSKFLD